MVDKNKSIKVVEETLEGKSNFFIKDKESFNKSIDHIVQLIKDSYLLYVNKSYPSSSFLSLAVIEEVSKVHIGIYIKPSKEYVKKDKLRDHMTKEIIGFNYTISMGKRLINAMDEEEIEEIFELVYSGEMKKLRENSIYCELSKEHLVTPNDIINERFSRNLLLFAIESFEDNLVGYTEYSNNLSRNTDVMFENIAKGIC